MPRILSLRIGERGGTCLYCEQESSSAKMLAVRTEHFIRPEVICVLNGEVGLVGPVVLVGCRKALSQS
jgi:hypothetical protein